MPRTWRAGGIIGPTTAKQNAGAGGVEVAREVREVDEPAVDARAVEVDKVEEPGVDAKACEVSC